MLSKGSTTEHKQMPGWPSGILNTEGERQVRQEQRWSGIFMINYLVRSDKVSVFGTKGVFDELNVQSHL